MENMIDELGQDDPVADKLVSVMENYAGAVKTIETFLERTSGIEDFDPEDLNQIEVHFKR